MGSTILLRLPHVQKVNSPTRYCTAPRATSTEVPCLPRVPHEYHTHTLSYTTFVPHMCAHALISNASTCKCALTAGTKFSYTQLGKFKTCCNSLVPCDPSGGVEGEALGGSRRGGGGGSKPRLSERSSDPRFSPKSLQLKNIADVDNLLPY
jgi:hypothetical protein